MVRASLAFGIGIWIGLETTAGFPGLESWWLSLFLFYGLALKITRRWYRKWYPCLAMMTMVLFVLAGMARSKFSMHQPDLTVAKANYFLATAVAPPQLKGKYYSTTLALSRVWSEDTAYQVNDRIQWYQDSTDHTPIRFGSKVVIKGIPRPIEPPANPKEFDYAAFMAAKNIFWTCFSGPGAVQIQLPQNKPSLTGWSQSLRDQLKDRLLDYLPAGTSREISMAMLLGDRNSISDRLEESFAQSGTIHVLAVSGLHLGILYWMLLKLFGTWRRHFLLKWLFLLICLMVLWTFTMVTGMAPSTQRAATMFSVLLLADTLLKQHSTINSLAVSAFVILWAEPYQLYSVGFQLSFLALGGILYLQPWIVGWWNVKNRLLRYFWELSTVSLSAQLAVLPLSIYYFHQVPVYFLLSNIVLIPLAFCIVVIGVIFFLSSLIPSLMSWLAIPLRVLTQVAGFVVQTVADLPVSTLQDIQISKYELFLWYGILGLGVVFLKTRQKLPWLLCLWLFAWLTLNSVIYHVQSSERKQIVFYHVPGHTAVDFISGIYFQSLMDADLASDHREVEYKINGYRRYLQLKPMGTIISPGGNGRSLELWMFQGKRVLLIRGPITRAIDGNNKLKSHIVVVSNNSVEELEDLKARVDFKQLVIDGSNRRAGAQQLQYQANQMGLSVHNSWEDGYKIINLE